MSGAPIRHAVSGGSAVSLDRGSSGRLVLRLGVPGPVRQREWRERFLYEFSSQPFAGAIAIRWIS